MLKFSLKQDCLHFTEGLMTSESDMLIPADDKVDLLEHVSLDLDQSIDTIIAALGQGND